MVRIYLFPYLRFIKNEKHMKTSSKNTKPEFTPIELTITIESQKELKAIKNLFGYNVQLSKYLSKENLIDLDDEFYFTKCFGQIFDELDS